MEGHVDTSKTKYKDKDPIMDQVHTPSSLENVLSWAYHPILEPLEEVTDLESIAYNCRKQAIINRTQKINIVNVDSSILCIQSFF
jgi:hypothetical protein